ncbi:MAG: NUDIX hydrolase [Actinomycetota bacterium]|nr:NUDIX hydrolase [Actinomycetota bacterium]
MTRVVRAAGGLVFRKTPKGNIKILIAHRPDYDDWSLPKGKADKGETPEETAVREVLEETGQHCRIVAPIGTTRHRIGNGVKEVNWFAMRPLPDSPGFKKNKEIDAVQWVNRKKAREILDYDNDKGLIGGADLRKLAQTGTIHLYRHGAAGNRAKWKGEDLGRPLTKKGKRQAEAIARRLENAGIERVVTSPYERCIQSAKPLAKAIGAKVEVNAALAEDPDVDAAYSLIDSLVGNNAVLCSHGDVIPAVINRMMWAGLSLESRFYCSKGSIWEIEVENGKFTTGRYVPPPTV